MLEMKAKCDCCGNPLEPDRNAYICSYECTYCGPCADITYGGKCPTCGGELVQRPKRKAN